MLAAIIIIFIVLPIALHICFKVSEAREREAALSPDTRAHIKKWDRIVLATAGTLLILAVQAL